LTPDKIPGVLSPSTEPTVDNDLDASTRRQLAHILASRTFHQADRRKRFLSFPTTNEGLIRTGR
jgi:hypothetical protein